MDLQGQIRAVHVYRAMKGHFGVDTIRTGGGGNDSGVDSLPLCLALLKKMIAGDADALNLTWAIEPIDK